MDVLGVNSWQEAAVRMAEGAMGVGRSFATRALMGAATPTPTHGAAPLPRWGGGGGVGGAHASSSLNQPGTPIEAGWVLVPYPPAGGSPQQLHQYPASSYSSSSSSSHDAGVGPPHSFTFAAASTPVPSPIHQQQQRSVSGGGGAGWSIGGNAADDPRISELMYLYAMLVFVAERALRHRQLQQQSLRQAPYVAHL